MSTIEVDGTGPETGGGLELIGDLAKSRRAQVEEQSKRPVPAFIESVEHAEVAYVFNPTSLPFREMDPQAFIGHVNEAYSAQLTPLDIGPLLKTMSREEVLQLTEGELLRRLLRTNASQLSFEQGRFPLRNEYTVIRSIELNWESIIVRVAGISDIAEAIVSELAEFMWRAAGVKKNWADIARGAMLVGYGTSTRIQLPVPAETLMNPKLYSFLQGNLVGGKNYARSLGRVRPQSTPEEGQIAAVATFDELHLQIDKFNMRTGASEEAPIRFLVTSRSDFGTGRLLATTNMKYEAHVSFLADLFAALESE